MTKKDKKDSIESLRVVLMDTIDALSRDREKMINNPKERCSTIDTTAGHFILMTAMSMATSPYKAAQDIAFALNNVLNPISTEREIRTEKLHISRLLESLMEQVVEDTP